jgi:transcriptional regulator with XRE-family HTH domain
MIFGIFFYRICATRPQEVMMQELVERIDGQKLRSWRTKRHISQRELAIEAGVTTETVNRIERADSPRGVQPRTLRALARVLDVDPDELLED